MSDGLPIFASVSTLAQLAKQVGWLFEIEGTGSFEKQSLRRIESACLFRYNKH